MSKNLKKLAIGSAIAAGLGYLTGILTAPKSGKETRQDVKNTAVKAKLQAEKELKKLHSEITKQLDRAKELSKKLKKEHQADLDKLVSAANHAKIKAKQMLSNIHDGGSDDKELNKAIDDVNKAVNSLKDYIDKKVK